MKNVSKIQTKDLIKRSLKTDNENMAKRTELYLTQQAEGNQKDNIQMATSRQLNQEKKEIINRVKM